MARPKKNNADYFTHDADMRNDPKIRALRKRYSHTGYAVWTFLLEYLTDCDFFRIEWSELNVELLAADFDVTADELREIVEYCIKLGLLTIVADEFLTCEKLQERMKPLMDKRVRRNEAKADAENLRSENSEQKEFSEKKPQVNDVSDATNWVSDIQNPQSKVKESKVNIILSDNGVIRPPVGSQQPSNQSFPESPSEHKPPEPKTPQKRFTPPTIQEVEAYCRERGANVNPERFFDYYTSNGWRVGKNPMKDWKAAVRTWEKNDYDHGNHQNSRPASAADALSANERRYGSTRAAKQSIEMRLKRLSDQVETDIPET